MKRFICNDIIPGCSDVFTGEDDQSVLDQVIAHAAADHGLVKPPLALVELVVATTHSYTAPKRNRHLRLVGAEGAGKGFNASDTDAPGAHAADTHAADTHAADTDAPDTHDGGGATGQAADLRTASSGDRTPIRAESSPRADHRPAAEPAVALLPTPRAGRAGNGGSAQLPAQELQPSSVHPHYRHECLLYGSSEELLDSVVPFIRDGLRLGEAILVAIAEPRQRALRQALGDDESRVVFADMTELANPARIIPALRQFVAAHAGGPIRGVGEPIWAGRRAAEITEAQFHESLMDVALAGDTPLWVLCPYDVSRLDAATIDEAHRSHASVVRAQISSASASFGGAEHAATSFGSDLPEPVQPTARVNLAAEGNPRIAANVLRFATARGLSAQRSVKLAAVIDEIAIAGARRSGQDITVRLWSDDAAVVCEVIDRGVLRDPLVGRSASPTTKPHDRDIRLANELCDLVQVRSNIGGTTVRILSWL